MPGGRVRVREGGTERQRDYDTAATCSNEKQLARLRSTFYIMGFAHHSDA